MKSDQLSTKLEELVNCLRENREHPVSIRDIASVTEVLISAVRRYFTDLDTSIYRELNQIVRTHHRDQDGNRGSAPR